MPEFKNSLYYKLLKKQPVPQSPSGEGDMSFQVHARSGRKSNDNRSRRNYGVDANVLTKGALQAHDLEDTTRTKSLTREELEAGSDRSMSFTVDVDDSVPPVPRPYGQRRGTSASSRSRNVTHLRQESDSHPTTPEDSRDVSSITGSNATEDTRATSVHNLPALQAKTLSDDDQLEPVAEDDPADYNLVAPADERRAHQSFSLEARGEQMFSREHLQAIFTDPALLLKFTSFLGSYRRQSVPTLIYYLDALKAIRAINYANAVSEALDPLESLDFTQTMPASTINERLEEKASSAFDVLVQEDLPAYITHCYINVVSVSIQRRITGTLPPHLREASEGLAEVFCLSDPSRSDNPIVFASEEFHRTTQYGNHYAVGRNCRFLQGPRTNQYSVRRLRDATRAGREHSEVFLNYRRDGSPFMNLLMISPLRDSRGILRYFIGAQVDVSGLAKECTDLDGLQHMLAEEDEKEEGEEKEKKDEFQELAEMFNLAELEIVKRFGGRMHREHVNDNEDTNASWHRPRLLLKDENTGHEEKPVENSKWVHGRLSGVYSHYLLVRPHPSLRILFTSPSLRVPGILQSPFMNRIGSSDRVRDELIAAFAEGRGVTAKVRWVSRADDEGRNRWIHCTPLLGQNNNIGVWMVVLVDEESSRPNRKFRQAPPVAQDIQRYTETKSARARQPTLDSRPSTSTNYSSAGDGFDFRTNARY